MKHISFACVLIVLSIDLCSSGAIKKGNSYQETLIRRRRYLGLSKNLKLNRRYQECVGPGDAQGHCKHVAFCSMDIIGTSRNMLDYLCIIEKTHIGVCCPDDVVLPGIQGSQIVRDLPASGTDYDKEDKYTGCGLSSMAKSNSTSSVQRWPWIVALYKPNVSYEQFCGGALISDQHVLTAAHCFTGLDSSKVLVRLGEYDFTKRNETKSRNFKVQSIKLHEDYDGKTYENDIAIVKLEGQTAFNTYIWPICLPPIHKTFENETAIVAGWGQIYYAGPTSELLLEVTVPVWEQHKCKESFLQRITGNNLCAAGYEGDKDSCLGDSGGPLLYQLDNERWVSIGIVSWGIGCGNKDQPGIYTRVNKYIPWILRNSLTK